MCVCVYVYNISMAKSTASIEQIENTKRLAHTISLAICLFASALTCVHFPETKKGEEKKIMFTGFRPNTINLSRQHKVENKLLMNK